MYCKLKATFSCLVLSCALHAQNGYGWLPPVTFPLQSNFCDNAPWQLVLYDDFNGTTLNPQWLTHTSYRGMQPYENDNWSGARELSGDNNIPDSWNTVCLKENVVVSNGTCKLLVKHEPVNLTCPSCPATATRYYSSGMLATPYMRGNTNNNNPNWFNNGRFEIKMKMPFYNKAHTTVWTWPSGTPYYGVDELDMTEAYGLGSPLTTANYYNLHAWGPNPNDSLSNPYHLQYNPSISGLYPYQDWWNVWFRNRLDITQWHTYTCEWDTASIKLYMDNQVINTIWKYYTVVGYRGPRGGAADYSIHVGSGCIGTRAGQYNITYAYPYLNNPLCNFRITTAVDGIQSESVPTTTSTLLGRAEIDYVKIWQRHPEQDEHAAICADNTYPATPLISGPQQVCPIGAFTVSPALSDGKWNASNQFALSNNTGSTASLYKQAGPAFYGGWISYSYGNGNAVCPLKTVFKNNLYCNKATDWQVAQTFASNNYGTSRIYFITEPYFKRDVTNNTTPVIRWDMDFTNGQDTYDAKNAQHYTMYGTFASSPDFTFGQGLPYNLKWTMIAYNGSDTIKKTGERNSQTVLFQQPRDTSTYYLNAYIDDQDNYDNTVSNEVPNRMVSEAEFADTLFVNEMIEKIKAEALEPYIIGADNSLMSKKVQGVTASTADAATKIYPNPIHSKMTIIAGSKFEDKIPIQISIYNLVGKLIKTQTLGYVKGNTLQFDMSGIASGSYIVTLKQNNLNDHIKITKE